MSEPTKKTPMTPICDAMFKAYGVLGDKPEAYAVRDLETKLIAAQTIIAQHDLCHNLHGKVDAKAFAEGCADEQRKLYGCAPHADRIAELKQERDLALGIATVNKREAEKQHARVLELEQALAL